MNKIEMLNTKIDEMQESLDTLLKSTTVSENTKRTQKFQKTKEIRTLILLREALEGKEFTGDAVKWFESLVTLTETRKAKFTVEVHKGDKLMDLLQKYADVKDVYNKLMKAAQASGLTLQLDHFE